jgi:hypothetical protein
MMKTKREVEVREWQVVENVVLSERKAAQITSYKAFENQSAS